MIKIVRVDHRLVHGQVIYSWVGTQGIDTIFVVNDELPTNELRKNSIRLAKPNNVKLVMKSIKESIDLVNSGVTDKYNIMVILESIEDAFQFIKGTNNTIKSLNLGGTKRDENTEEIFNQIHVSEEDKKLLNILVKEGIEVEARMVPKEDKKIYR